MDESALLGQRNGTALRCRHSCPGAALSAADEPQHLRLRLDPVLQFVAWGKPPLFGAKIRSLRNEPLALLRTDTRTANRSIFRFGLFGLDRDRHAPIAHLWRRLGFLRTCLRTLHSPPPFIDPPISDHHSPRRRADIDNYQRAKRRTRRKMNNAAGSLPSRDKWLVQGIIRQAIGHARQSAPRRAARGARW